MSPREGDSATLTSLQSDSALKSAEDKLVKPSRLTWGYVHVREYNRTVGDNPETTVGPPLTLDWQYNEHEPISLSTYEEQRPKRRVYMRLRLSSVTRKNLLKNEFGIPEEDIAAAEKEIQIIKRRREATNKQGKMSMSVETTIQSAKRKIWRRLSREGMLKGISAASGSLLPMTVFAG